MSCATPTPSFLRAYYSIKVLYSCLKMFSFAKLVVLAAAAVAGSAASISNEVRQNNLPPPFGGTHSGDGESLFRFTVRNTYE